MLITEEDVKKVPDGEKKVVLLQSGGLDSCFLACLLSRNGFEIHHLFVDYGQNSAKKEREYAHKIAAEYGGEVSEVKIDLPWLETSTVLVNHEVEEYDVDKVMGCVEAGTYVPMRNHLLISIAASYAEAKGIQYIASAVDGNEDYFGNPLSGCPDKHPSFVKEIENSLTEGSSQWHIHKKPFTLIAPLVGNTKEDTIQWGLDIGCDFSLSWTCYNGGEEPCGKCCACIDRANHFLNLGISDPALKSLKNT